MKGLTADTHTWLAARTFLLDRCDDFFLQLTRSREAFEVEAIHDLRVSTRRLREGIALFAHCFRKRQLTSLRTELKSLTDLLGAIRNTDEAILFFSTLVGKSAEPTAGAVANLIARLQAQRLAEQRQLKRALKKIDPGALLGRIDDFCRNPRIFDPAATRIFLPVASYLLEAISLRELPLLELLPEAVVEENVAAQHRLRIAVKRFRYRLEFMAPLAQGDYQKVYREIKAYQEVLGHMHDLDVFSELTRDQSGTAAKNDLLGKIISDRRHELFSEFLSLQESSPLDKMGDLVRRLL